MEIKKYRGKNCIIILKNRLKYEGKILEVYDNSLEILDREGKIELAKDSISVIINKEEYKNE
jgi:small nuclear ribonucleoprotein (snRNP)-like protein